MSLKARDRELEAIQEQLEDLVIDLPEETEALDNLIAEIAFLRQRLGVRDRERSHP